MKVITLSALILSAAMLTGCGGGSGTAPVASTTSAGSSGTSTTPASSGTSTGTGTGTSTGTGGTTSSQGPLAAAGYIVDYYGDSTIYGVDGAQGGNRVATPAPLVFDQTLQTTKPHQVRNEGVSSTTCIELLNGTDGVHPPWNQQMTQTAANVVIVNHGINDSFSPSETVDQYKSCLSSLVSVARQNGKAIILETPNVAKDSGGGTTGLDAYVTGMRQVAAAMNVPLIDQYQMLNDYMKANNLTVYDICPDGLHPTQSGYTMKGQYAAKIFTGFNL